jgi:uncharacterized protein YwqG
LDRNYAQMIEVIERPFPLTFIAQINFAEAWRAGPLDPDFPKSGLLSIFYDTLDEPWGFNPADQLEAVCCFRKLMECNPPVESRLQSWRP